MSMVAAAGVGVNSCGGEKRGPLKRRPPTARVRDWHRGGRSTTLGAWNFSDEDMRVKQVGVAMIGCGGIALQNHLPGFALCPQARVVALCDCNPAVLERAKSQTGIAAAFADWQDVLKRPDVDAVVIATPNFTHAPIALAAIAAEKHVMCEKPIAMNLTEAKQMLTAAEAAGIVHMTAFTYRFVPAMRYMTHLVKSGFIGQPYHFRAQRFQDWGDRNLAWRQVKKLAATGELGDMLSHRIDFAHLLVGPMARLVARMTRRAAVGPGRLGFDHRGFQERRDRRAGIEQAGDRARRRGAIAGRVRGKRIGGDGDLYAEPAQRSARGEEGRRRAGDDGGAGGIPESAGLAARRAQRRSGDRVPVGSGFRIHRCDREQEAGDA